MRRLGLALATLSLVLGACGNAAGPSRSLPSTSPTPAPASATAPPVPSGSVAPSGSAGATVAVDPTLLGYLPATVNGLPIAENGDGEASAVGDPEVAKVASAAVAGLAVDSATGQFVFAVVVRLKPGALDDASFRDWRDSFDQGACSQANGVSGNAQTDINGRTVYIGACAGGLRTYHVWVSDQNLLISASSVGDSRLGEKLMDGLRL